MWYFAPPELQRLYGETQKAREEVLTMQLWNMHRGLQGDELQGIVKGVASGGAAQAAAIERLKETAYRAAGKARRRGSSGMRLALQEAGGARRGGGKSVFSNFSFGWGPSKKTPQEQVARVDPQAADAAA